VTDPTTAAAGSVQAETIAALQSVLAAQHAAVYAYAEVGVNLVEAAEIQQARDLQAAHRLLRDSVAAELVGLGATPVAAMASYQPPAKLVDAPAAQRWALQLEQTGAAAYRYLLTAAAGQRSARTKALSGLVDAAQRSRYWRTLLTPTTPTEAFPGI
jgi:hypothetical protein